MEYKVSNFSGPLDLLLGLLSKNKVEIADIFISDIIDQFLDIVETLELDNISEFILMASRLIYIKSQRLLPNETVEKEQEEITRELYDYQKIKELSDALLESYNNSVTYFCKEPEIVDFGSGYEHNLFDILQCIAELSVKKINDEPDYYESFSNLTHDDEITIEYMTSCILDKVSQTSLFSDILADFNTKNEIIVAFLSVLELCKQEKITLDEENGDIYIRLK